MDAQVAESSKAMWAEWARTYATLLASLKNLLLMQIYGTQVQEEAKAQLNLRRYRDHMLKHHFTAGLKFALPQVFGTLLICMIALSVGKLPQVTPGLLISYFYILVRFVQCLAMCAQHAMGIASYRAPFEKLYAWWHGEYRDRFDDRERALGGRDGTRVKPLDPAAAAPMGSPIGWRLEGVGFRYPGAAHPTLEAIDLSVAPGSALVILGPSGAGKSTLLNLVLGQLEPTQGRVEVTADGGARPLGVARARILPALGYVGPESFIIEGSIRANLMYGLPFAPADSEVKRALELAGCDFVRELGLEHPISEQGTGLSAGQKQRLSLARALLRRPRALILDEATSNLDAETEAKLVRTLGSLKGGMTLIAVTHRQALLEIADQRLDLVAPEARGS
jgi:ABC-type multidrug transport system fused ATPase/permease subunit